MLAPAAVLWDLDGTLVDTEPMWIAATRELVEAHGATWTEDDAMQVVGRDLMIGARIIVDTTAIPVEPSEVVEFLVERVSSGLGGGDVPWRPGARAMLDAVVESGLPQALVTMSYARIAAPLAASLPFDTVVTGDVVPRGKPHPDPYLLAAERLGVDPADCLAIEDSPTGAMSAQSAGCATVVVPHLLPVATAPRQVQVSTLEGHTPASLAALF